MKKIILPLVIFSLFSLPQNLYAQEESNCRKTFDKASYKCLTDFNACSNACQKETEKPDGTTYFNSGEIYKKCMQASDCEGKSKACREQSLADFRACGKSGEQPVTAEAKTETPQSETKSFVQSIDDWIRENHLEYNPDNVAPKPSQLKEEMFQKAQEAWKAEMVKAQAEFMIDPKFELLWEGQWPNVKTAVFDSESGAIIKSDSWQNIYLQDLADQITKKVVLKQGDMEVKVINANPTQNKVSVEVDDFFDIFVIQTHFRVEYDPDKKLAQVDIYEGEVEVKTKDGKVAKIKPDGDKPAVLVVTRRISPLKLAIIGLALATIVGFPVYFLKRKKTK